MDELTNFERKLLEIGERLEKLIDIDIPFIDLFNRDFMAEHTQFSTIAEMFEASGHQIETKSDLDNIPEEEWDEFVCRTTCFDSWEDMLVKAASLYVAEND